MPMHIRIARGSYQAGNENQIRQTIQAKVVPAIQQQSGFHSYVGGIDRTAGRVLEASLWDSKEYGQAISAQPSPLASLVQFSSAELYRVATFPAYGFHPNGSAGAFARVTAGSYDPAKLDALRALVGQQIATMDPGLFGSLGITSGADLSTGKIVVVSLWQSASQAKVLESQQSQLTSLVQFDPAQLYEIAAQV